MTSNVTPSQSPLSAGSRASPPAATATAAAARPILSPEQITIIGEAVRRLAVEPSVQDAVRRIGSSISEALAPLRPLASAFGSTLLFLGKAFEMLPVKLRSAVVALTERGWFFDPEITLSDYWEAAELLAKNESPSADAFMATHFEARLDDIEARLCTHLPHRAAKFKSAFAAHRRGEYDLSILAFLAQADGVSKELRGGHFFLKNRKTGKPETAVYADAFSATALDQIVHLALVQDLPLKAQMDKRTPMDRGLLNRHAVMHGESLDYDSKENSLRAVSLLNYVALALEVSEAPRGRADVPVLDQLTYSAAKFTKAV